ncbi:MAG: hypothetical protein R3E09_13315 [Novosphingobium sp.]|nr:hypothetical protein [Novosphingobium sp.]
MTTTEVADHFNMNLTDHPYWAESSWFHWAIPEKSINGSFYSHVRPNMNLMMAGPYMWDPSGEYSFNCLYWDWQAMRLLPEGRYGVDYDKYDYSTPWGMSVELLEPLKRYKLGYHREGFDLDLEFEATAELHAVERKTTHGLSNAYNFHFEQPGRIVGTVVLDGVRYDVDTYTIRDGSHGPRFLEVMTPNGYTWSTADDKTGWHILGADNGDARNWDIVSGFGYLLRDGKMASIVNGVRRVLERNGPRPSLVEVTAEDELGRTLHAIGRPKVAATFTPFPDRGTFWQQFAWDYDGFEGAVGEDQETRSIQDLRRWNRAGPEVWNAG